MALGLFAREWERTCANCGYTWRVSRAIVRGRLRASRPGFIGEPAAFIESRLGLTQSDSGIASGAAMVERYRICRKCGVDDFTQRPVSRGKR